MVRNRLGEVVKACQDLRKAASLGDENAKKDVDKNLPITLLDPKV